MKYTIDPWHVTGMSKHGPYIKVRGTIPGDKWEIANIPFTATDTQFYAVKEAEEHAQVIRFVPTMYRLMEAIAKSHTGVDIVEQAKAIVDDVENFKKYNK